MSKAVFDIDEPVTLADALEAWSEGRLSDGEAMEIGGIEDMFELISTAIMHDIPFRTKLTPEEERQATEFTAVLREAIDVNQQR